MTEALISIRAAAKKIGITDTTLGRQIKAGSVRSHGGKVRLSEVLEDRKNNVDHSFWSARKKPAGRGSETKANAARMPHAAINMPHAARRKHPIDDREPAAGFDVDRIMLDGKFMTIGDAKALKETYLARLAKFQLDFASGAAAEAEAERWRAWVPGAAEVIASAISTDRMKLTAVLEDLVLRKIAERSKYLKEGVDRG